jgi:hypothetical protein
MVPLFFGCVIDAAGPISRWSAVAGSLGSVGSYQALVGQLIISMLR